MLFNFQIFLDFLGLAQGLVLGVLLIVLNKNKNRSTLFLGLFVLIFSLKLAYFIGRNLNLNGSYPEMLLLPFNFSWFLFPFFLIYIHQVSVFSNRKPPYWTMLPGIILFFLQLHIYLQPYAVRLTIADLPVHEFFHTYVGIFYSWSMAIWALKLLNQHRKEVGNYFSKIEHKELQWARYFLVYSVLYSLVIHLLYFIDPFNIYYKILFSIFDLIALYWIAYYGISQRNISALLYNENFNIASHSKLFKNTKVKAVLPANMQQEMNQIDAYIIGSKLFIQSDLTIIDLAESLKIHPKLISTTINTVRKQNFNSYINQFRIEEAVELIKGSELNKFSMEGIGNEVGFNSKSAFYTAFKKVTGTTPIKYKEKFAA